MITPDNIRSKLIKLYIQEQGISQEEAETAVDMIIPTIGKSQLHVDTFLGRFPEDLLKKLEDQQ